MFRYFRRMVHGIGGLFFFQHTFTLVKRAKYLKSISLNQKINVIQNKCLALLQNRAHLIFANHLLHHFLNRVFNFILLNYLFRYLKRNLGYAKKEAQKDNLTEFVNNVLDNSVTVNIVYIFLQFISLFQKKAEQPTIMTSEVKKKIEHFKKRCNAKYDCFSVALKEGIF